MIHVIETLQYAEPGEGPWRLYTYTAAGFHCGAQWFCKETPRYPDEEIPLHEVMARAGVAIGYGLEVRICDGADQLVLHAKDGEFLHGRAFWSSLVQLADRQLKEKERLTSRSENG